MLDFPAPVLPLQPRVQTAAAFIERHPGAATSPIRGVYRRREPENSVLHRVVSEHLEPFLADAREHGAYGQGLPRYVERELRRYLQCGILDFGFARVRCEDCGTDRLVAFSCKDRGICPSCTARRAHDTAFHLVDHVFPRVPVRHWVMTYPRRVRWHLATDPKLATQALDIYLRALFAFHRKRARTDGVLDAEAGSVSFVQRFASDLGLNLHFHSLIPDGVFGDDGFHELRPPDDAEVEALVRKIATRTVEMLRRRGRFDDDDVPPAADALAALQAASSRRRPGPPPAETYHRKPRTCALDGFSLSAEVRVHAEDREGLLRLALYGARGPLALERLSELPDGRLAYRMKRRAKDGRDVLLLTGPELIGKLAAIVPPPRSHLTRFHGLCGAPHKPCYAERSIMRSSARSRLACSVVRPGADSA